MRRRQTPQIPLLFRLVLLFVPLPALVPAPVAAEPSGPPIRIRLTAAEDAATVTCPEGLRVLDLESGRPLGPEPFGPKAIVVAEHAGGRPEAVFRAQVASLTSEEEARSLAADLGRRLGVPYRVHYHADRRAWRVRLGAGRTAAELDELVRRLGALGYDQVWVTEDVPESERGSLRIVDASWNDYPAARPALRILPAAGCTALQVGERSYRGGLEARLDRTGALAIINELPLEEYLRGVVPNELGPAQYPEVEALKAQTVAARTYAWRNRGQFGEDGYDLCDTPRCQVYKGAGTEHALTDRAIRETAGIVATRDGEPIHALYSSTCGGHTEAGRAIFPEETGAYLQPVACYPEGSTGRRSRWALHGRAPGAAALAAGGEQGRDLLLLEALGVLEAARWSAGDLRAPVPDRDARAWIDAALRLAGKGTAGAGESVGTRDDLVRELVRRLDWDDRAELLVAPEDLEYLLDFPDAGRIGRRHRRNWALLLKDGVVVPFPDGTLRPADPVRREGLAAALAAVLRHYDAEGLTRGTIRGVVGDALRVGAGDEERVVVLPADARLVKELRGDAYPVAEMTVLAGDRLRFLSHRDGEGTEVIDFAEVHPSARSASDDRFTNVYEWEVRLERDEVAGRLAGSVRGIGELRDLRVLERGASGRVTALEVEGDAGTQRIRGFPIRTALGLRDTSFTIDRQIGADGLVAAFLFSGKGWGHGVGMCQVGAYGMALRGADYEEILHHYYTGIDLQRVYAAAR